MLLILFWEPLLQIREHFSHRIGLLCGGLALLGFKIGLLYRGAELLCHFSGLLHQNIGPLRHKIVLLLHRAELFFHFSGLLHRNIGLLRDRAAMLRQKNGLLRRGADQLSHGCELLHSQMMLL